GGKRAVGTMMVDGKVDPGLINGQGAAQQVTVGNIHGNDGFDPGIGMAFQLLGRKEVREFSSGKIVTDQLCLFSKGAKGVSQSIAAPQGVSVRISVTKDQKMIPIKQKVRGFPDRQ